VKRAILAIVSAAALMATPDSGDRGRPPPTDQPRLALAALAAAQQASDDPIYYQDPDGRPFYSAAPKKTPEGRDYRPVPRGADLSFEDETPETPAAPATAVPERKIKFYRNPMGLADTSPTPKKDSMGMNYIPVYEGDESDDGLVKLSPGKIQLTGVKAERVGARVLRTIIRAPGTIQLDERRLSVISMRSESFIQTVANVTTGSRVAKGQPLMDIYSSTISAAAAEHIATLNAKSSGGAGSNTRGSRQRLVNLGVPEQAIVAMETSGSIPLAIEWSAPRDGVVVERNAVEGMRAQAGDVLFRVADLSVVWASIDVSEQDLGALAVGLPVVVRARSYPGCEFVGKLSLVYPQINRETRTARIRVELSNSDMALLPDMYVDAEVNTGRLLPVLAVPESAVLDTGDRQLVFIERGHGRYEPRDVKLGHRGDGYVEVRGGIVEGESVVVTANFLIDAESNLKAALKGFTDAGEKP
jgi:membrane fusion protein, copper/silver efflux system